MPKEQPKDMLNESTDEVIYRSKNKALFTNLVKTTRFNKRECEAACLIHRKIQNVYKTLNLAAFRDILHSGFDFTENRRHVLLDRIFSLFDKHNNLQINSKEWVTGLAKLLDNAIETRIHFGYGVYDLMKSNQLTKDQMFPMLRGCFIKLQPEEDADDMVKDMIDLLVKAIDINRDGDVSLEEMRDAVLKKNLLFVESMGPVFPSREAKHAFLSTITDRVPPF
ncbi:PREDICTED: EF-hand calcium-binding domain-containing protein 1-like [Ceratosolen solmsi marchali]|uniref:EF-hand calcium-binding domain-containing protein 1-like n=1 Tax=Ceratosolen solmsi marchali TaxID=326594 RepID=A0AAJ7DY99_9HYME|nr:PREDICTED: EF-hand calcium-binding domain-containing protein 1-like [Ceratosolen solmsi marchali]